MLIPEEQDGLAMRMLVTASRSLSSTEANTVAKDYATPVLRETSSDENGETPQDTPEAMRSRLEFVTGRSLEPAAPSEAAEVLRVTVLYLEGIHSPIVPTVRIAAWVGFRSSFPSDAMAISSCGYSSYFLKEGSLLAVESDQVKWTPDSASYSGVAFWDSLHSSKDESSDTKEKAAPKSHLDITIPSPGSTSKLTKDNSEQIQLPDILEFHICLVCERGPTTSGSDDTTNSPTWRRINSSTSMTKWDNIMEEEHWYKDDTDDDNSSSDMMPCLSLEQELQHGVAHLKVPRDTEQLCTLNSGEKILQLPVRTTNRQQSQLTRDGPDVVVLDDAATLSIQVEKVRIPTNTERTKCSSQRHYVQSTWNGVPYTAPLSVKCGEDGSHDDADPNNTTQANHFHLNTTKSTVPTNAGTILKSKSELLSRTNDEGMCKIQQSLESSFKSMTDRRELAAAMRQQRENQPASPERYNFQTEQTSSCAMSQGLHTGISSNNLPLYDCLNLPSTSANLDNNKISPSSSLLEDDKEGINKQDVHINQPDQQSNPSKQSIMQRFFCGASMNCANLMHHCDEEQVGIYVVNSQSMSS